MVSYNGKNSADKAGIVSIISMLLLIGGLIFIILFSIRGLNNTFTYRAVIILWVLVYLFLTDWLEPYFEKVFNDMTAAEGKKYMEYFALDVFGFVCLTMFALTASLSFSPLSLLWVLGFVIIIVPRQLIYSQTVGSVKKRKSSYSSKKTVKKKKVQGMQSFADPELSVDRFEKMDISGYVNNPSVDDIRKK